MSNLERRKFIQSSALMLAAALGQKDVLANSLAKSLGQTRPSKSSLYMPDESAPHERTWMAFVARDSIWSAKQIPRVKRDLALIANTIAKYEPVSILVSPNDRREAESQLNVANSAYPIELIPFEVDDLWLRDTGPTFVTNKAKEKIAVDFNFNGWGNKQAHSKDKLVAKFIAQASESYLERSELILEGGCFEVDGHGTAIMTKSCIANPNRNPGWSLESIEEELKALLGLRKIIWLEGVAGKDITDGHTDFYARFIRPGEVVVSRDNYRESHDYEVTRENIEVLRKSVDADGRPLKLTILDTPDEINEDYGYRDFAAGYIGYYVCNGALIAQKFGDKRADARTKSLLQAAFPDRVIEQISIDGIASGGGSVHCATQQEIRI